MKRLTQTQIKFLNILQPDAVAAILDLHNEKEAGQMTDEQLQVINTFINSLTPRERAALFLAASGAFTDEGVCMEVADEMGMERPDETQSLSAMSPEMIDLRMKVHEAVLVYQGRA